jgi:preprotein translocase subunit SecA
MILYIRILIRITGRLKMKIVDRVLKAGEGKTLKHLTKIAEEVASLEKDISTLTDSALQAKTIEFKDRLAKGEELEDILTEAFAVVREASKRVLGQRHYDVQIMGGAALHLGNIAQMNTGEGKTLVSTLPAYLNALTGKGVHIVTVNEYLATRDAEWMGQIHKFLGLTVGVLANSMTAEDRQAAYLCDITYGTNTEFGFDYLRDNMALNKEEQVQRGFPFAIIDEVDSILIDEARTPLLISGLGDEEDDKSSEIASVVKRMTRDIDYEVNEKDHTVSLTEVGIDSFEKAMNIDNLYDADGTLLLSHLSAALKAKELFKRDRDYLISPEKEVLIIDEHTGRTLAGRRYNDGLHQAIEAKEGVKVQPENQTLATVTLQNFFRMYDKLSGMTGTASTEAAEFQQIYNLGVVPIPSNKPVARIDRSDSIYRTRKAKLDAVVEDIKASHAKGQPLLIGTTSVERSEEISNLLMRQGIKHNVLNAKEHAKEAEVVAEAGRLGAVTVATNMAGRGTDIILGGNVEHLTRLDLLSRGFKRDTDESLEKWNVEYPIALERFKKQVEAEREKVLASGGLYVLSTERHESRRIDNQLRGRAGRQGDIGESKFYLSLEDDLMRIFKADVVDAAMRRMQVADDIPIELGMVNKAVASAQAQVEGQHFDSRKDILKYDEVLNIQRQIVYKERSRVLAGEDVEAQIALFAEETIRAYVEAVASAGYPENWDLEGLWGHLRSLYPISLDLNAVIAEAGAKRNLDSDYLTHIILEDSKKVYAEKEVQFTPEVMRDIERRALLLVVDRKWRDHLYEMDYLKEGIGMRSYAQRDPLVEYKNESHGLFSAMMSAIAEESVRLIYSVQSPTDIIPATVPNSSIVYSAPSEPGVETRSKSGPSDPALANTVFSRPGGAKEEQSLNSLCACGSGKKYKRCHGAK